MSEEKTTTTEVTETKTGIIINGVTYTAESLKALSDDELLDLLGDEFDELETIFGVAKGAFTRKYRAKLVAIVSKLDSYLGKPALYAVVVFLLLKQFGVI